MKVLMVNKFFFVKGGSGRYLFELTQILRSYGHEIIHFAMKHNDNLGTSYEDYFIENIDFNPSDWTDKLRGGHKIVSRMIYSLESRRRIEKLIERTRPDIAHLHMIDHQISPSILHSLSKFDIPVVQTVHQYKLICPNYLLYNMREGEICEKCLYGSYYNAALERCHKDSFFASLLVCLETYIHKLMRIYEDYIDIFHVPSKFIGSKLVQIGMDKRKVKHLTYSIRIDDYPFDPNFGDYFAYYGRLSKEKGILTLLEAMREIPTSRLLIVGDGPQRLGLEEFARENNLTNVSFVGFKQGTELKSIIARSRFVVVPSEWYDNSPLVIYESFAMGVPVIASDIGGIPELVDHNENGFLFKPGDVEGLIACIRHFLGLSCEEILAYKIRARSKAEREFNPDLHYRRISEIYNHLLES